MTLASGTALAESAEDQNQALVRIEAATARLEAAYTPHPARTQEWLLASARQNAVARPEVASGLFSLALAQGGAAARSPDVLIEAGRAEALAGNLSLAAEHFLSASELAWDSHRMASAVEGFIEVAARLHKIERLPSITRYIELVGTLGMLDEPGYEAIYMLGRRLAVLGDERCRALLELVPTSLACGRRATYVLGTLALGRGEIDKARELFAQAAALGPYPLLDASTQVRDQTVREMSFMAVGRLAFEAGDPTTGSYAYHQVDVDSPLFAESFLELGWLALESGHEEAAVSAFSALTDVEPESELGRRAALLRGWVLIREGRYQQAQAYYTDLSRRFTVKLEALERELAQVRDFAALAEDCEARRAALANSALRPLLAMDPMQKAQELVVPLEDTAFAGISLDAEIAGIEALLADGGEGFLARHNRDAGRISELLQETRALSLGTQARASRESWNATLGTPEPAPDCCFEPRHRLTQVRERLERLLTFVQTERDDLRKELQGLTKNLHALREEQRALMREIEPVLQAEQRALAEQAAATMRQQLRRMVIEGETGVLEAIWRYKEDHREVIRALEVKRREALDQLEESWR